MRSLSQSSKKVGLSQVPGVERIDDENGTYEGLTEYSTKKGLGCYLWYNGNFYNGYWKNDQMEGFGTLYYSKGGKLRGNFVKGKLHGFGRCEYPTGDCYIGMWQHGEFHGKGLFYKKAGDTWVLGDFVGGELKSEDKSGQGIPSSIKIKVSTDKGQEAVHELTWKEKIHFNQYIGDTCKGMRHGNGLYTFTNGSYYEGQWQNNLPNGLGLFHYSDGKFDAGVYKNGYLSGYGFANYSNGDMYEGYFADGNMDGFGLLYEAEKREYTLGFYKDNKVVQAVETFKDRDSGDLRKEIYTKYSKKRKAARKTRGKGSARKI